MINSAQKKCFRTFLCQVMQNKNILPYPLRGIYQSQKKCDSQLMSIGNCWNITTDCHCLDVPRSAMAQSSRTTDSPDMGQMEILWHNFKFPRVLNWCALSQKSTCILTGLGRGLKVIIQPSPGQRGEAETSYPLIHNCN